VVDPFTARDFHCQDLQFGVLVRDTHACGSQTGMFSSRTLGIERAGCTHVRRSQCATRALGGDIDKLLPGVHRVASLPRRWLLSTHQGAVGARHLAGYLNEFCFRFIRGRSRGRGLPLLRVLQLAVGHRPLHYRHLTAHPKPKETLPATPGSRGHAPWIVPEPRGTGHIHPDGMKPDRIDSPVTGTGGAVGRGAGPKDTSTRTACAPC
jgi:hypothetical protein